MTTPAEEDPATLDLEARIAIALSHNREGGPDIVDWVNAETAVRVVNEWMKETP